MLRNYLSWEGKQKNVVYHTDHSRTAPSSKLLKHLKIAHGCFESIDHRNDVTKGLGTLLKAEAKVWVFPLTKR